MSTRRLFAWLLLAAIGVAAIVALVPRLFPFRPLAFETSRAEAEAIALERARDLGELPEDPYVVTRFSHDGNLAARLLAMREAGAIGREALSDRWLQAVNGWETMVFPAGAPPDEWRYRVRVTPEGEVVRLRMNLPADVAAPEADRATAPAAAAAFLAENGIDPGGLGPPEVRTRQLAARTDLVVRFPVREPRLGEDVRYGVDVVFVGDRIGGFEPWRDDPDERRQDAALQQWFFVGLAQTVLLFLAVPLVAVPFVRRYHEGEVGVRRGTQIFLTVLVCGIGAVALLAPGGSFGTSMGTASRHQVTGIVALIMTAFTVLPAALGASLAWSLGEARVRERRGDKLTAFDALFRGDWTNGTVARSSLVGVVLGIAIAAATLAATWGLARLGYQPVGLWEGAFWGSDWMGLALLLWNLSVELASLLIVSLFFSTLVYRRVGLRRSSLLGAALGAALWVPPLVTLPLSGGAAVWVLWGAAPALVFAGADLLTALLAGLVASATLQAIPLLIAADPWLQLQGLLPLVFLALPLAVSLRWVQSRERLVYTWDDVPPHVRRIAERERQRVELETAREIQSSILPDLPPQLAGVELAHAYLPATEVGGDFYDVLALEDGRLAVAVGDVAGHGVSSGLVMSMVKSALAVQASFRPDVGEVMATLNRLVYQSARRRLLTTLAYAILDPRSRELEYGSAGHIFPYRVTATGSVQALEGGDYPLGVRPVFEPRIHRERLAPGDSVVLLSDGVVEGRREGSEEPWGFDRLERSLSRHAGSSPQAMTRGLLADFEAFTGRAPREDDVTILVLRLPAA